MSRDSVAYVKSKAFASRIVKMYIFLTEQKKEYVMAKQVLRSGTSIGANLSEAVYGTSRADFLSKTSIALKEAHETLYWLELLGENGFLSQKDFESISQDCRELVAMLVSSIKTLRKSSKECENV